MSKVFSYEKYKKWIQQTGERDGGWAKKCDGQPVREDGNVIGKDRSLYTSSPEWEVEK